MRLTHKHSQIQVLQRFNCHEYKGSSATAEDPFVRSHKKLIYCFIQSLRLQPEIFGAFEGCSKYTPDFSARKYKLLICLCDTLRRGFLRGKHRFPCILWGSSRIPF